MIDGLDLRAMSDCYRGSGSAFFVPRMLLGILVYGYATGVFSSRKLEQATYDLVAFRFIAANDHPDHDTIATFRRRFLKEIEALFVEVLKVAREMGVPKIGTIGLDGAKVHPNASRHSALSYEHACKIETNRFSSTHARLRVRGEPRILTHGNMGASAQRESTPPRPHCVADDPAIIEPVFGLNSLRAGNSAGNFFENPPLRAILVVETFGQSSVYGQIPCVMKQGIFMSEQKIL